MGLGYHLVKNSKDISVRGENAPSKPNFKPLSQSEIKNLFGKIDFTIDPNKSSVKILGNWQRENIVTIEIPGFSDLPPYHTNKISVNKKTAEQFKMLFEAWAKAGLTSKLLSYDGSFNPRLIRGSRTTLSNHTYGIAIDFNFQWNKLGVFPASYGSKGSLRELVEIANDLGFYWGGHFSRKDGMHFEIGKLLSK
jgi:hypothetical protein